MEPLVSICCITYNHEKYIADAIESFLMQEVDFPYEIIVHDDASMDNTQKIIKEYESRYPELIKTILQTENQYSKGFQLQRIFAEYASGKYLAICEGDDYWTDPHKLQKQIDFLEANVDCIATAHNVRVIDECGLLVDDKKHCYKAYPSHTFTLRDAEYFGLPGQMASLVFRNIWPSINIDMKELYFSCSGNGDQKLAILLTLHGDIFCFADIMADHRKVISGGTSWSAENHGKNMVLYNFRTFLDMKKFAAIAFGVKLDDNEIRLRVVYSAWRKFLFSPNKENRQILKDVLQMNNYDNNRFMLFVFKKIITWPVRRYKRWMLNS